MSTTNHTLPSSNLIENGLQQTLRALSACGETLIAISAAEPNDGWGEESPFNQRCLTSLALAVQLLADNAYCELLENSDRQLDLTISADMAAKLDHCAEQYGISRDEIARRLVIEELHRRLNIEVPD